MTKLKNVDNITYQIVIRGVGGDFTLGTICPEAAEYWADKQMSDLVKHLIWPEDYDHGPSEERLRLADYRDSANMANDIGFEEIEKIKVYQTEPAVNGEGRYVEGVFVTYNPLVRKASLACKLFTRTRSWGHLTYPVKTTGVFDTTKLEFDGIVINGIQIVNKVIYDGVVLEASDDFEQQGQLEAEILSNQ